MIVPVEAGGCYLWRLLTPGGLIRLTMAEAGRMLRWVPLAKPDNWLGKVKLDRVN
jgi:hypothetical protein